ncbi:MAG: hypothetical protein P8N51_08325 [Pseudomonadales bacterium]|nr:hypothetical protein [Pseudomonadales bacterium]MDG1444531.1 hypothetical protein [Pseudomonadales bacterium]
MKITHIKSSGYYSDSENDGIWLLSKGNKVLYRGKISPWQSPRVVAAALRMEGKQMLRVVA